MQKAKKNWGDNFNCLFLEKLADGNKEWRFALEEHKTKGTMQMNIRQFQLALKEGDYEGPTSHGFIKSVKSIEDIESMEKLFQEFFKKCKEMI